MDTWSAKRDQSSFWTLQIHVELCVCLSIGTLFSNSNMKAQNEQIYVTKHQVPGVPPFP